MVTKEQMIERMARALCVSAGDDPDAPCFAPDAPGEPRAWTMYQADANAALDASGLWPVYEAAQKVRVNITLAPNGCVLLAEGADEATRALRAALTATEKTDG